MGSAGQVTTGCSDCRCCLEEALQCPFLSQDLVASVWWQAPVKMESLRDGLKEGSEVTGSMHDLEGAIRTPLAPPPHSPTPTPTSLLLSHHMENRPSPQVPTLMATPRQDQRTGPIESWMETKNQVKPFLHTTGLPQKQKGD